MTVTPLSVWQQNFQSYVKAGYSFLFVNTTEETRVLAEIKNYIKSDESRNFNLVYWDAINGLHTAKSSETPLATFTIRPEDAQKTQNPIFALDAFQLNSQQPAIPPDRNVIGVFHDFDDVWVDHRVRRKMLHISQNKLMQAQETAGFPARKRLIVVVSAVCNIPDKLKSHISLIPYDLPNEQEVTRIVAGVRSSAKKHRGEDELFPKIVQIMLGLTAIEIEDCVSRCYVLNGGFNPGILPLLKDEKAMIVKKSDILTYIPEQSITSKENIAGVENFSGWLESRAAAYTPQAKQHNIDYPRGVVLIGPPGTGKSVVAKTASQILNLPGYTFDIGAIFGSKVGESEQRMRDTLKQIDANCGAVLLIDEADKALGNAHEANTDSGVTQRVFGLLLSWLAEKKSPTFVIMTLNRTKGLPPELLRAGRFDAIFSTDLPTRAQRQEIFNIHFRKRSVDVAQLNYTPGQWVTILDRSKNFVGAEIEVAISDARFKAFAARQNGLPTAQELIDSLTSTIPMYTRSKEDIDDMREYCQGIARPVGNTQSNESGFNISTRNLEVN